MKRSIAPALAMLAVVWLLAGCGTVTVKPTSFTLTGTVTYGGTSDPVEGATVSVAGASDTTDALGGYSITGTYTDARQEITVSGAQAADFSDYVDLSLGAAQNLAVRKLYYVDPDAGEGNDANDGSAAHPLRTITCALGMPEDKLIQLTAGTYDETSGETFPLVIEDKEEIRGVAGNPAACIITRNAKDACLINMADAAGSASFKLSYVTLDLQGVTEASCYGVKISGGNNATIEQCRFLCHTKNPYGVWIADDATQVSIDHCLFDQAEAGVYLWTSAAGVKLSVTVSDTTMTGCTIGINDEASKINEDVTVENCIVSGCGIGIVLLGNGSDQLMVRGSQINGNTEDGINFCGVGSDRFLLRNTQVKDNVSTGINVTGNGISDLGTTGSPGDNIITGNQWNLWNNNWTGSNVTVNAVGNTWNDPQPSGTQGSGKSEPNYTIDFPGNWIKFSE